MIQKNLFCLLSNLLNNFSIKIVDYQFSLKYFQKKYFTARKARAAEKHLKEKSER